MILATDCHVDLQSTESWPKKSDPQVESSTAFPFLSCTVQKLIQGKGRKGLHNNHNHCRGRMSLVLALLFGTGSDFFLHDRSCVDLSH